MSRVLSARDVQLAAAAVRFVARRVDPALLTSGDCEHALREAAAIEAMGAAMKAMLAARLAASDACNATSATSPETHIAAITGATPASARSQIELGGQLHGALGVAAKGGALSVPQMQAIAGAVKADPAAEAELLAAAPKLTLGQLRDRCAQVIADADPNPEATARTLARQAVRASIQHARRVPPPARAVDP